MPFLNALRAIRTRNTQQSDRLNVPFVELDALNWEPNWMGLNDTNPDELMRRMQKAMEGDRQIIAETYTKFPQQPFWPRLETHD